jgi:hypothetical protein
MSTLKKVSMIQSARMLILSAFFMLLFSITFNQVAMSQPPPPPPGGGHGLGGNQGPGGQSGAPVGDGLLILIGLAGLYGGKKFFAHIRNGKIEHEEKSPVL